MAEENTIQERLTEIFDDPNIYTELRKKIIDSIRNEIYYNSELKNTHFNEDPTVFEQFVDVLIKDILNDIDFRTELKYLNKLRNLEYSPEEIYSFRKEKSNIIPSLDLFIVNKIQKKERLTPEEEAIYNEFKQKEKEYNYNNQLVLHDLEGYELNDKEQERMNEFLKSLISEEDVLDQKRIENEPKIRKMRENMKKRYFEDRLSKMPQLIKSISDPFELKEYERKEGIFKGVNGNTEFVRVEEHSDKKSAHDFEVTSEYIIMDRKKYHIQGSFIAHRGHPEPIEHYGHTLLIYMPPKENEYPEGTHLSDLIRKEKETEYLNELSEMRERIIADGLNPDELYSALKKDDEKERN